MPAYKIHINLVLYKVTKAIVYKPREGFFLFSFGYAGAVEVFNRYLATVFQLKFSYAIFLHGGREFILCYFSKIAFGLF